MIKYFNYKNIVLILGIIVAVIIGYSFGLLDIAMPEDTARNSNNILPQIIDESFHKFGSVFTKLSKL